MNDYFQSLIANCAVEWRAIPGYEGLYEASSAGLIRSLSRMEPARGKRPARQHNGRILSPAVRRARNPYQSVVLSKSGKNSPMMVHAAVAMAFHGLRPLIQGKRVVIDHINNNVSDNRPCNLRYCTNEQNVRKQSTGKRPWLGASKSRNKWKAVLTKDGVRHYIGLFPKREDALAARRAKEKELFGEFAPVRATE